MNRKRRREIDPGEHRIWLGILLDAVFDPTSRVVNLRARAEAMNREYPPSTPGGGWNPRIAQAELLSIASDVTDYPDDIPPRRAAELLVLWAERWLTKEDWDRLQGRVRKRRQQARLRPPQ